MGERCENLQKGLYTNFSEHLSFTVLLRKKKGIRNCTQAKQLVSLSLHFAHYCISWFYDHIYICFIMRNEVSIKINTWY